MRKLGRSSSKESLEICRQVRAGKSLNHYAASLITSTLERLIRGIFEPIARETKLVLSHEAWMRLSLNDKRAHIANLLYRGLPILQIEARFALMYALEALNAGAHPPFLRITVQRRGAEPDLERQPRLALVRSDRVASRVRSYRC